MNMCSIFIFKCCFSCYNNHLKGETYMNNEHSSDNFTDIRVVRGYQDEALPILKDRPDREKVQLPEKLRLMKNIAKEVHTFPKPDSWYFYKQALFAADYTDDFEYNRVFRRYFPTYRDMKDDELRGYFSFRTRFREGRYDAEPQLSFVYVYIYEILNGIGVTPESGFEILKKIDTLYGAKDETLHEYLRRWIRDYIIYYNLDRSYAAEYFSIDMDSSVSVLMQAFSDAENRFLVLLGEKDDSDIDETDPDTAPVTDDEVFQAVCTMSSYAIEKSPLYKKDPELVKSAIIEMLSELSGVAKRLNRDSLFEYCFGRRGVFPISLFRNAVFYDHLKHEDHLYKISPLCLYRCVKGRWSREAYSRSSEKSKTLGDLCHETDRILREKTGFGHSIKRRLMSDAFSEEISWVIDKLLLERERAARPRVDIDLSILDSIRMDAARTRDSLLIPEDEEEIFTESINKKILDSSLHNLDKPGFSVLDPLPETPNIGGDPTETASLDNVPKDLHNSVNSPAHDLPLSNDEFFVLNALLHDLPWKEYVQEQRLMLNMLCDDINEKMMDIIGDTIIEFNGDEPELIEDYIADLQELIPEN